MVSKSFKILLFLLISILSFSSSHGEEKIDIWKNKKNDSNNTDDKLDKSKNPKKNSLNLPIYNDTWMKSYFRPIIKFYLEVFR